MFTNEIISDCEKASLDDLIELEQKYDFVFPEDLKFFYTQYNGGKPRKREVCLQDGDWKSSTRFHGFYSVKDKFEKALSDVNDEEWWIKGFIPLDMMREEKHSALAQELVIMVAFTIL